MLIVLISWLIQYIVFKAAGHLALKAFPGYRYSWFNELIAGYCLVSVLAVTLSLIAPINFYSQVALFAVATGYLIYKRNSIQFPEIKWRVGFIIIAILVLLLAVPIPNHGDSAFYHAQALKWVESYRVIPGLGNFFSRIAFNSSFFNTQAMFSFFPVSEVPSRFINSFLFLIWLFYLYEAAASKSNGTTYRMVSILFAFITLLITRGWVSSVAPDVAAGLFMLIIFYQFIKVLLFEEPIPFSYFLVLVFTAITIKLPAVFTLPLLAFYPGLFKKFRWTSLIIPAIILTPWLIRHVLLSGYLIYPYFPLFVWEPDWLIPPDVAMVERHWISSWARIPAKPWEYVLSLPFEQWFPIWFKAQYVINKILFCLLAVTLLYNLINFSALLFRKKNRYPILTLLNLWGVIIIVWFLTAPDFRFGYGLIMPYLILAIFHYFKNILFENSFLLKTGMYAFPVVLGLLMTYVLVKEKTPIQQLIIKPQNYYRVPLNSKEIGYLRIHTVPDDESCWDSPLPCINDDLFPDKIEMRGPSIKDGFRPMKEK